MSKTAERLARTVSSWLRRQRQMITQTGNRRAYGSTAEFAGEVEEAMLAAYPKGEEVLAEQHARELARQLQDATMNMLREDRPLGEVFGPDRAALIGVQESNVIRGRIEGLRAAKAGDEMLEWQTDSKPCKICIKLRGKRRWPGKMFAVVNGEPIYAAPLHVSCKCRTVRVKVRR